VGSIDERGEALRGFGIERGGKQGTRQQQDFGLSRQTEADEQILVLLGGEDAIDSQPGPQGFRDQVGSLDAGPRVLAAAGMCKRVAEFFEAGILLTLYNTERHRWKPELLCRFYADFELGEGTAGGP